MASIFPRKNKNGSISWRVLIRRTGIKPFITSFPSQEQAKEFVDRYEEFYCLNHEVFPWDKLKRKRENEFEFKKNKPGEKQ